MEALSDEIRRDLEGFDIGETVELFTLDATRIGGAVYYFAPAPVTSANGSRVAPQYGGTIYNVIPFESDGWSWTGTGTLPRPKLIFKVSREDGDVLHAASQLLAVVEALDDLIGARVLRVETLRKYLDDGAEPNSQINMGVELYEIEQKPSMGAGVIEFQLTSALDQEDVKLPRRQVLNRCQWRYRRSNQSGGFDYTDVTCPYVGAEMFDALGNSVPYVQDDRCGKLLKHCKLRFGANKVLPFGGFPGVGRLRI